MSKLLYIQASPREEWSHSRAVAQAFVEVYKENHPGDTVEVMDLFKEDLPAFDGLKVQAKYTILHGKEHTPEERAAWRSVEAVIERFKSADKYVIATPMWNFGIPYRLKQYLDILIQPGYTFSFSPKEGYKGLVLGKPVVIVSARGGEYGEGKPGAAVDFQKRYLDQALGFMGFDEIHGIDVEPTLAGGPKKAEASREEALARAKELARSF